MKNELECIEVKDHITIPFLWLDPTPGGSNLGRAEFEVCIKYKRGRVGEYWVYPAQQRDQKHFWHYAGGDVDFCVSSYERLEEPKAWLFYWCKTHKAQAMRIYAPPNSKFLRLDYHGVSFCRTDWDQK
jgi:hypothetical protein